MIGGWALGVVGTVQSGAPVTVITQTNSCNCFSAGSQRANVVRDPNLSSDNRSVAQWFDTVAFAQPATLTFGNKGVGIVRAPGRVNFDASLARTFRITERLHTEIRGEFFNALNHTNFGLPGSTFGSPSFGVISSSAAARQIELGARVVF